MLKYVFETSSLYLFELVFIFSRHVLFIYTGIYNKYKYIYT
jgi:hypothetical protein